MKRTFMLLGLFAVQAVSAGAQARDSVDKTFFTRRDLWESVAIFGASAGVAAFDERIARWTQRPNVQGDSSRQDLADALTFVNETPLTIAAFAAYGIGRISGNETLADVGLHTTESLVLTVGLAELIRGPLGRLRPRASPDDAFKFEAGKGFTDFAARSYPSIHAAVAFATASSLVAELKLRKPGAVKYAKPILYTAALIPGFTRMYLNQHWASDVVAGTFMGTMLGSRVVEYAHTHRRNKLDRALLGAAIVPTRNGAAASVSVGW
jgi:membrane-associated phospholipid phosphatase